MYSLKLIFIILSISTIQLGLSQQTDKVDFIRIHAEINTNSVEKKIDGKVSYSFRVLQNCDSIYLDAINMRIINSDSKGPISIHSEEKKIWFLSDFKKDSTYSYSFSYEASPKQTLYFNRDQIWTQGQGKYTSHWLPSLDDMNDKIEFDLSIAAPKDRQLIANGKLDSVESNKTQNIWHFNMEQPMSSYLAAFAIGDYSKLKIVSDSGIPIELYYDPKDSVRAEPTYRYTKHIFDFLENEIGVPYPWQNYKQIPVRDFLYAGMENTTATIFSEAFVVDSIGFNDRNYVNVNAHELAHHWFGNLATESSGDHHWLQEGFSTYYALLSEKEIFGKDYFYWKLYQSAEQLKALSDEEKGESLLDPKASSLTFYEKGAWALHILKEKIGENAFKTAIRNYLTNFKFKNVTTNDFLNEVNNVYEGDLSQFRNDWLEQSAFKAEEAYRSLIRSDFVKGFFEISALREIPLIDKKAQLLEALDHPNDFIGQEIVFQLEGESFSESLEIYRKAFNSENRYIRQSIALSMTNIPQELKEAYESLLNDDSYVTKESALGNLWINYPEDRSVYLNSTRGIIGFQDKNLRQFWLFLAIITNDYHSEERQNYLKELRGYTSAEYSFEIREKAFGFIDYANWWDDGSLLNLIDGCMHYNWRFRKSSRAILRSKIEDEAYLDRLMNLYKELDQEKANLLSKMMNEE